MWQDNFTECPIFQSTLAYLIYYNDEIHLVVSAMDKRVYYGDLQSSCLRFTSIGDSEKATRIEVSVWEQKEFSVKNGSNGA